MIDTEILALVYIALGLVFYGIYSRFVINLFTDFSNRWNEWILNKSNKDNRSLFIKILMFFPDLLLSMLPKFLGLVIWITPIFWFVWLLLTT